MSQNNNSGNKIKKNNTTNNKNYNKKNIVNEDINSYPNPYPNSWRQQPYQQPYQQQFQQPYQQPFQQPYQQPFLFPVYVPQNNTCCRGTCYSAEKIVELSNTIQKLNKTVNYLKKKIKNMSNNFKHPINKQPVIPATKNPFIHLDPGLLSHINESFNPFDPSNKYTKHPPKIIPRSDNSKDGLLIITVKPDINDSKNKGNNKHKKSKNISDDIIMSSLLENILGSMGPIMKNKTFRSSNKANETNETNETSSDEQSFEIDLEANYEELNKKIETLEDLIYLGKLYDEKNIKKYSFDLKMLNKILGSMEQLNNMIGLEDVKKSIIEFIIYHSQKLEKQSEDMFHTIIQGPPGVGKTELGKILGKIYKGMGIIKSDTFKIVRRSDLIGKYLGHTAAQTQEIIDECEGGIMFIDEAYALGNEDGRDSYSKECIDTINLNLSENKNKFICIIAGYKDALDKCFFSYNEGLRRRFAFRYTIEGYNPTELAKIFAKKAKEISFEFDEDMLKSEELEKFFENNKDSFPDYGGDMETLLLNCKITHSNRIFGKHPKHRKKISKDDIKNGMQRFLLHRQIKKDNGNILSMYT